MSSQVYTNIRLTNQIVFDFHKLACLQPVLRPYVYILNCRTVCNFKEQPSLIGLTKAIMKHCFNWQWECPLSNLCPRVPGRLNYLLWVNTQLSCVRIERVLDVGTGATLIYPLLGLAVFGWRFIATEIDSASFQHSKRLITLNKLQSQIDLRLIPLEDSKDQQQEESHLQRLISQAIDVSEQIDLVVCNPPFFEEQCVTLTTMTNYEHHTTGGEYTFFFNLYRESFMMQNIHYFTCLIGLQRNFQDIKVLLIQEHRDGYLEVVRFGQIQQGNNLRYIVMWKVSPAIFNRPQ